MIHRYKKYHNDNGFRDKSDIMSLKNIQISTTDLFFYVSRLTVNHTS